MKGLRSILKIADRDRAAAQRDLAEAQRQLAEAVAVQARLSDEQTRFEAEVRELLVRRDMEGRFALVRRRAIVDAALQRATGALQDREADVESARSVLLETRQRHAVLEKLLERRHEERDQQKKKQELRELDEYGALRDRRARAAEGKR